MSAHKLLALILVLGLLSACGPEVSPFPAATGSPAGSGDQGDVETLRIALLPILDVLPFHVAEQFTNIPGKLVSIEDTISGFNMIIAGAVDHYPEAAFMLVGTIEEAIEKGEKLIAESK